MLQLDKEDIERYRERSKVIRGTIRQDKQLEKNKKKKATTKTGKGCETSVDKKDWRNRVDDRINAFQNIKIELETRLGKLEVTQDYQAKLREQEH